MTRLGVCLNFTTSLKWSCWTPSSSLPPLGQLLGGLRLLLGDLLLRHDGHPGRHGPGDGLLGHVVVVDDGEKTTTPAWALGGVVAIHPCRHAPALLCV